MNEETLQIYLKEWFGFSSFRKGQREPIESILKGKNTLAVLPTGTGKSLIYQFCAYSLDGLAIVVSPLISLMENQVSQLKHAGEKRAAALNSMSTVAERRYLERNLRKYKFLFLSPEMLQTEWLLKKLKQVEIGLFVVDEAHCISQWGLDFRPDYLNLDEAREKLGNPLTLALTATAPQKVAKDIVATLNLKDREVAVHQYDPNRENLFYEVIETAPEEKNQKLLEILRDYPLPGIIYFTSKSQAESVCRFIKQQMGLQADTYHADRTLEDRGTIQRQFLEGRLSLICATSAFGMGINKSDIRSVIHYHLPGSLEEYLQEAGRAGRDGQQSLAVLLYSPQDYYFKQRKIRETSLVTETSIKEQLKKDNSLDSGLSDFDAALLQAMKQKQMTAKEGLFLVETRIEEKLKQLYFMKEFAESAVCKRQLISNHFGYRLKFCPLNCCSICQSSHQTVIKRIRSASVSSLPAKDTLPSWEEKIKNLFRM